jgi:hypothetical protein
VRLDWRAARDGEPGAWLAGASLVFMWVLSPFAYTFGLFTGSLALTLSIASAAIATLRHAESR